MAHWMLKSSTLRAMIRWAGLVYKETQCELAWLRVPAEKNACMSRGESVFDSHCRLILCYSNFTSIWIICSFCSTIYRKHPTVKKARRGPNRPLERCEGTKHDQEDKSHLVSSFMSHPETRQTSPTMNSTNERNATSIYPHWCNFIGPEPQKKQDRPENLLEYTKTKMAKRCVKDI